MKLTINFDGKTIEMVDKGQICIRILNEACEVEK